MAKNTKKPKPAKTAFTATEVGALIEDLRSRFKVFGEKLNSVDDKLDATMGMVAKNREDITMLNLRTIGIKGDITKINGKLAKIEEDLRIIKTDFDKRLTRLEAIK